MVAVLFSSGIDSWACLNWAVLNYGPKNVIPLYIDFGQCYAEKEIAHAERMCNLLFVPLHIKRLMAGEVLVENPITKHVPFRNLFFLQIAAMIPSVDTLVFGMIKGDWSEDKNPKFVRDVGKLLNTQLQPTIHRPEGKIKIVTPFAYYTKAGIVKWLIQRSRPGIQGIKETIGCYDTDETSCGQCISCFSRWVALYLNDMHSELPDSIYVRWMVDKLSVGDNPKKEMLRLLWRKRSFMIEAHRAMNRHCHSLFGRSFLNMYLLK